MYGRQWVCFEFELISEGGYDFGMTSTGALT